MISVDCDSSSNPRSAIKLIRIFSRIFFLHSARDSNVFTVSVNVEANGKVTFNLTYEQLLTRTLGQYENIINVDPGQVNLISFYHFFASIFSRNFRDQCRHHEGDSSSNVFLANEKKYFLKIRRQHL